MLTCWCCDRCAWEIEKEQVVSSIERLYAQSVSTCSGALVSVIWAVFVHSFCIFKFDMFHWAVKNATLILLIAVHFVVTHEEQKMTAFISVKTLLRWDVVISFWSGHKDDCEIYFRICDDNHHLFFSFLYFKCEKIWWKENRKRTHLSSREEWRNGSSHTSTE